MQLIAHRGLYNDDIKENTIDAFNNAIKNKYNGFELDIRKTKDNKIVVIHDLFINRTSNGSGVIYNMTYKELLKYNFGSKKKKSKIPLLKDIILKFNNKKIFIELKCEIKKEELENILNLNKSNDYYIMSFNKKYIDNILGIKYKLGIINYVFNSYLNYSKYNFIVILEELFNESIYKKYNKLSLEIVIYGVLNNISLKNKEYFDKITYII